jgi:hypothetical protein
MTETALFAALAPVALALAVVWFADPRRRRALERVGGGTVDG